MSHTILFIGGGQMAEAILRVQLKNQLYQPAQIMVNDIDDARLHYLAQTYQITPVSDLAAVVAQADIIVLGVRPQDPWAAILQSLSLFKAGATLISIIAGVTIAQLNVAINAPLTIIRTIPNTLTDTGFGYSGVVAEKALSEAVNAFFSGFSKIELIAERLLDTFTGYGVAGPNYIYYFYESLVDAGVLAGLPRDVAKRLALENLKGAAAMLELSKKHPRELLDINNSPAGVGMHGLYELNNSDFAAGLQRSVLAAVKRTTELGQ